MTTEALPAEMLARLLALGAELLACARQHRDAPLATLEQAVLERVRAAQGGLLEVVLEQSTTGLAPAQARVRLACPGCGERGRVQDWRARTVRTVLGPIRVVRPWYGCAACGHGWSPTDATLELAPRARLSVGLQEWVGELGAETAFRQGRRLLAKLSGQWVSKETIRRHSQRQGLALAAAQEAASVQVARTREAAEPVDPAPGQLLVEADGVVVPYLDGWHEVKVGLVAGHGAGELTAPSYVAAREPAEAFGRRLLAEAARRGALEIVAWQGGLTGRALGVLRRVVVLGDGAVWIWNLASEHFGERIEIVDFYHAVEHLWAVARALHGPETAAGTAWAEARRHELRHQGPEPVLRALAQVTPPTPEARDLVRRARGYFRTNAARMAYPTFRAAGLPIGSGAVESAAKHLVQQRMKRAGMRWSEPGARGLLALLAHRASGRAMPASAFLSRPQPRQRVA
jgi:hypothetical protein